MTWRLLVAAPVSSPASVQVALALEENGTLAAYYSATGLPADGRAARLAQAADHTFGSRLGAQVGRRVARGLPRDRVVGFQWRTALTPITATQTRALYARAATQVAAFDGAVGFRGALPLFEAAKALGRPSIYMLGGLDLGFVGAVEAAERKRRPGLAIAPSATPERMAAVERELDIADLLIFNSGLCRDSHSLTEAQQARARVIPLGFPPVWLDQTVRPVAGPLKVLWAGAFSAMKGAHDLLEALGRLGRSAPLELTVFGRCSLPPETTAGFQQITFRAPIPHSDLMEEYRRHDILVLPTLHDSFGMVISEAMSQGVPVITTDRAGAAQFIRSGSNGVVVPAADPEALASALEWAMTHRDALADMGEAAKETAAGWQWGDYRTALAGVIGAQMAQARG